MSFQCSQCSMKFKPEDQFYYGNLGVNEKMLSRYTKVVNDLIICPFCAQNMAYQRMKESQVQETPEMFVQTKKKSTRGKRKAKK